jgi:hypothetical protein
MVGSAHHAKDLRHCGVPVAAVIALKMVGCFSLSDDRNSGQHGFSAAMMTDTAFYRHIPDLAVVPDLPVPGGHRCASDR